MDDIYIVQRGKFDYAVKQDGRKRALAVFMNLDGAIDFYKKKVPPVKVDAWHIPVQNKDGNRISVKHIYREI